jgi:hypothetical protein
MSGEQRSSLMALGSDLATAWDHPDTDMSLRKRIVRALIKEIVINNLDDPPSHELHLHWQGGVIRNCVFPAMVGASIGVRPTPM